MLLLCSELLIAVYSYSLHLNLPLVGGLAVARCRQRAQVAGNTRSFVAFILMRVLQLSWQYLPFALLVANKLSLGAAAAAAAAVLATINPIIVRKLLRNHARLFDSCLAWLLLTHTHVYTHLYVCFRAWQTAPTLRTW